MSPFVAELILIGINNDFHLTRLKEIPSKDIQWGLFLSMVIWSYGGFDSMGSLAGEVKGGRYATIFQNKFLGRLSFKV